MPWAGNNFKEWQTKGLDKCQTVTCTIEDFENGSLRPKFYILKICNSVWNDPEKHDELKCSKAFKSFQFVYVNGSYLEAEGDYAGGCPYGDPHCEDVVKFEFPVFNLLFLGKFQLFIENHGAVDLQKDMN